MLSVFLILCFLCLVRCLLSFFYRSSLLRVVALFEKFFGSELLFLGVGVGRVFFGAVLPMFLLYFFGFSLPKVSRKNSLDVSQVWGLWFFFSSFGFSLTSPPFLFLFFFLLKRESLGSNRAHPHTHLGCFFLFLFLSRRTCLFARFGRASRFLAFFRGAILGPAFLGFSWNLRGLSSLAPSEALFWTPGGKGVLVVSLCCFCFPNAVRFCHFCFSCSV